MPSRTGACRCRTEVHDSHRRQRTRVWRTTGERFVLWRLSLSCRAPQPPNGDVLRIPSCLDLGQSLKGAAERGLGALGTIVLGQEVDVGATGRETLQVVPCLTSPLNVRGVVVWPLPRARDVQQVARVAVACG